MNNISESKTHVDVDLEVNENKTTFHFFPLFKIRKHFSVLQVFWHQKSEREKNEIQMGNKLRKTAPKVIYCENWDDIVSNKNAPKRLWNI